MQASWNQWNSSTGSYVPNYPSTFPAVSSTNPFQVPSTGSVTTPAVSSQFSALYNQQQTQATQQQQWQQWEQWQQQYAQWQQQYGDKFQAMQTTGVTPASNTFPALPPLPSSAPTVQPPPPDSIPPNDKNADGNKRAHEGSGNEESKKQKTGKGKTETLESLIESEKTFDQQFKSWEVSFIQWKEQNANHPDKAQYKEYEAKWESFRGQLLQKREALRKKRENKEAEVAAAAAAAKEAALATSTMSNVQSGYSTTNANPTNPYVTSSMMYPMSGLYPSQDVAQMMSAQTAPNYMSNFSMFNMPPPPSLQPMPVMTSVGGPLESLSNKQDPLKINQSLEFLSSSMTGNSKSIPGLDLASDKSAHPGFMSNIPINSSLFSYNQDVTKPLHTSDDKPFNFPRPPQINYDDNDAQNQYSYQRGRARFGDDSLNQFRKNDFPPFDGPDPGRGDRFGNRNVRSSNDYNDDYNYRPGVADSNYRNEDRVNLRSDERGAFRNDDRGNFRNDDRGNFRNEERGNVRNEDRGTFRNDDRSKFGLSFTPSFNSDKYAKYLEDEYDDSRFRDPEPSESPQNKANFSRDDFHRGGNFSSRQNIRNDSGGYFGKDESDEPSKRDFSDSRNTRGGFNDRRGGFNDRRGGFNERRGGFNDRRGGFNDRNDGRGSFADRTKDGAGFGSFNRDDNRFENRNQFGKLGPTDKDTGRFGFGRRMGSEADLPTGKLDNAVTESKSESIRPMSLLDMPLMKPPEMFDGKNPFPDKPGTPFSADAITSQHDELHKPFPGANNRFTDFGRESKDREPLRSTVNSAPPHSVSSLPPRTLSKSTEKCDSAVVEPFIPLKIFEYDHISRNNEDAEKIAFEPLYVFDYSHGKKKPADYLSSMPKSEGVALLTKPVSVTADNPLFEGGESWEIEDSKTEPVALPPRSSTYGKKPCAGFNSFKDANRGELRNSKDIRPFKETNTDEGRWSYDRNAKEISAVRVEEKSVPKPIDDLLCLPGRTSRAAKLVIIMRGPPGSGKTYAAKLIKDKEVEMGGSVPRILSLDDYFTVEDLEETDPKSETKTEGVRYEYDAALEPTYLDSLIKSFKKTISDGFFPFIIVDCTNEKLKKYEDMYSFAVSKGFQVYICEMSRDLNSCIKRNIHNRSEEDISKIIEEWETTPPVQTLVDIRSLLQSAVIPEVDITLVPEEAAKPDDVIMNTETTEDKQEGTNTDEVEAADNAEKTENETETAPEEYSSYMEVLCASKWEKMEQTEEKLDRLDGIAKKRTSTSFKDWLQLPDEGDLSWYTADANKNADVSVSEKKRVRWADLEERVAQQKMRAIGFVVGHTDWNRMMDPTFGEGKLTQTKYIYK